MAKQTNHSNLSTLDKSRMNVGAKEEKEIVQHNKEVFQFHIFHLILFHLRRHRIKYDDFL